MNYKKAQISFNIPLEYYFLDLINKYYSIILTLIKKTKQYIEL